MFRSLLVALATACLSLVSLGTTACAGEGGAGEDSGSTPQDEVCKSFEELVRDHQLTKNERWTTDDGRVMVKFSDTSHAQGTVYLTSTLWEGEVRTVRHNDPPIVVKREDGCVYTVDVTVESNEKISVSASRAPEGKAFQCDEHELLARNQQLKPNQRWRSEDGRIFVAFSDTSHSQGTAILTSNLWEEPRPVRHNDAPFVVKRDGCNYLLDAAIPNNRTVRLFVTRSPAAR